MPGAPETSTELDVIMRCSIESPRGAQLAHVRAHTASENAEASRRITRAQLEIADQAVDRNCRDIVKIELQRLGGLVTFSLDCFDNNFVMIAVDQHRHLLLQKMDRRWTTRYVSVDQFDRAQPLQMAVCRKKGDTQSLLANRGRYESSLFDFILARSFRVTY